MGSPPPSPPVITCCSNGARIAPAGVPLQLSIISDQIANLVISFNNYQVGSYSNVTSKGITLTPNANYNPLRVVGTNANGSTECVCPVYGTTPGENGSYAYYDENNCNNIHFPYEILQGISRLFQAGGGAALLNAANALSVYLMNFENPPPGGAAVEGPIPCFAIPIVPVLNAILPTIPMGNGVNLTVGQSTVMQYNSDYANNRSGQGTILVNNNQSIIFWGPENWM